jgi:hydrogenase maturation protease
MWMGDDAEGRTVVIGLGNPLMGDDGTGLAALERLQRNYDVPDDVLLVDGGTWGMNLLPIIETAGRVLMLDAITFGGTPGELVVLHRRQLPKAFALKFSPHQLDMREVLAAAELRGTLPDDTIAVGVQPGRIEMGLSLSPEVEGSLDQLVGAAAATLQSWGHTCSVIPHEQSECRDLAWASRGSPQARKVDPDTLRARD